MLQKKKQFPSALFCDDKFKRSQKKYKIVRTKVKMKRKFRNVYPILHTHTHSLSLTHYFFIIFNLLLLCLWITKQNQKKNAALRRSLQSREIRFFLSLSLSLYLLRQLNNRNFNKQLRPVSKFIVLKKLFTRQNIY